MLTLIPLPYKLLAVVLLVGGTFFYGYMKGNENGKEQIRNYELRVERLQNDLAKEQANIKERVVTQFIDKIQVVKEKEYVFLDKAKNDVPSQYNLSNGWLHLHDSASQGILPDSTRTTDATASDIRDNQALGTVVANYSKCLQNAQQLIGLQQWVIESDRSINKQQEQKLKDTK